MLRRLSGVYAGPSLSGARLRVFWVVPPSGARNSAIITSTEELIAFARERLAHFKCPTRVEFVAELPRNATGKILKTTLRTLFGGQESAVHR